MSEPQLTPHEWANWYKERANKFQLLYEENQEAQGAFGLQWTGEGLDPNSVHWALRVLLREVYHDPEDPHYHNHPTFVVPDDFYDAQ